MANTKYKLDYIKISNGVKAFALSNNISNLNEIYFGDIEDNNTLFSDTYNKGCLSIDNAGTLQNILSNNILHNLYKSSDMIYKSSGVAFKKNSTIFSHTIDEPLLNITQLGNVLYSYSIPDEFAHYNLTEDIYQYIARDTGKVFPNDTYISTVLYDKIAISNNIEEYNKQQTDKLNFEDWIISDKISTDLKYTKIFEIPGFNFNDYDSGEFNATSFKSKTIYNSVYDTNYDISNSCIKTTRKYVGIDANDQQVYLKYVNDKTFDEKISAQTFQNLEVLHSINRPDIDKTHKASLFNIDVKIKLSKTSTPEEDQIKNLILLQLKNQIRTITNKLKPVNSQLFKINF